MSTPDRQTLRALLIAVLLPGLDACTPLPVASAAIPFARAAAAPGPAAASRLRAAQTAPALGKPLDAGASAGLSPTIYPDGQGLPQGQGLAAQGALLYRQDCASCHGRQAEGGTASELVGGDGPLSAPAADKTLLTYWPYATTLFDTIARSMPPSHPGQYDANALYALCAFLLSENGLWPVARPLDAAGLTSVRMPNRDGFIRHDQDADQR